MARFCTHCGARNEDDAAFCEQCGQPLAKTQTQPADPPNSRSVQTSQDPEIVPHKPARRGLLIGVIAGALLIVLVVVVLALTLGGTSRPSDANFSTAIQHRFDTHDPKCMLYTDYPRDTTLSDFGGVNKMSHALAHAGLFSTTVYKVLPPEKAGFLGPARPATTLYSYTLTALGKRYWAKVEGGLGKFYGYGCFGFKREVVAITNFTKEDSTHYKVDFTYKFIVPAWAKQPKIVNVASSHNRDFWRYDKYLKSHGEPIKKTAYLTLTHNGWRTSFMSF